MQLTIFAPIMNRNFMRVAGEQKGDNRFGHVLTFPMSCFSFPHNDIFSQFEVSRGKIFNIELKMHVHKRCLKQKPEKPLFNNSTKP